MNSSLLGEGALSVFIAAGEHARTKEHTYATGWTGGRP